MGVARMRLATQGVDHPDVDAREEVRHLLGERVAVRRVGNRASVGVEPVSGAGGSPVRLIDRMHANRAHPDFLRQWPAFEHGGIAPSSLEAVSEAPAQAVECLGAGESGQRRAGMDEQRPQIIDAVAMIGMIVRPEDGIEGVQAGVEELLAKIGAGVDQDGRVVVNDRDRGPPAPVSRLLRIAGAPVAADPGDTEGGSAAEQAKPNAGLPGRAPQPKPPW